MSLGDEQGASHGYGGTGQTRTRLPDPGVRRTGRSSRGTVTVVGVVVLLIAAIAFANRGGDGPTEPSVATDKPEAAPTAPSGALPVATGFARDEQGAQSAAANYAVALGSADMFDESKRHAIVGAVYAPEVSTARREALDKAYASKEFLTRIGLSEDGTAPSGQTFVSRVIPVGTKVTEFTRDQATVELWYTSLFGLSGDKAVTPVTESWYTTTYQLTWADEDWRITDFEQTDGPVPVRRDQRASTADDMTKAVEEYGGFTYAR
ncbi:hypothetical protein [Streptomyces sp. HSG2]|uniref:hypothetical protein n=1 Tax=Streptomyces sp. HSG2 TaxID=2797167 RepID=UPI001904586D|nr:hypothetical protein [Streptomyces sp. HSG2]